MAQLRVDLIDSVNNRSLDVNLPDDVPLEQLVPALARKLGLPHGEYALSIEQTGKSLAPDVTLAGAGVGEGTTLRLERSAPESPLAEAAPPPPAPSPPTTPARRTGVPGWTWGAVGGVAILLATCIVALVVGGVVLRARLKQATPTPEAIPPTPSSSMATPLPSPTEEVVVPTPAGLSNVFVEFILDASGSMMQTLEGKTRLRIAKDVLGAHIRALPAAASVGLRVYGHRISWQDDPDASCQDIELLVPILPRSGDQIAERLETVEAKGMTPMSESVKQAADDFTFEPGRRNSIILISDGQETCGDDPCDVVRALREVGIDFTIHVIGLEVDEQTRAQLQCIAQAAGGRYHDAHSERDLDAALQDVISVAMEAQAPTPAATATLPPPTSTPLGPTSTPMPPTPTPAPTTPAAASPTIVSIDFPGEIPADSSDIGGLVRFRDLDGDVNRVTFDVISATDFEPFEFNPRDSLVEGNTTDGAFNFYMWCTAVQQVTLRVTLYDEAGNSSSPVDLSFRCE